MNRLILAICLLPLFSVSTDLKGLGSELRNAALKGDKKACLKALDTGAEIDSQGSDGFNALLLASQDGHYDVCDLLIERKATVDVRNGHNATPLYVAAQNGHEKVVQLLLEKGADRSAVKNGGYTVLQSAVTRKQLRMVELLLREGLDVNAQSKKKITALHLASEFGFVEIGRLLIENGADVNAKRFDGVTPLHLACLLGKTKIVKKLSEHELPVDLVDESCFVEFGELLVKGGADVNATRYDGVTPLHLACLNCHTKFIEMLLKGKISIDPVDRNGSTAMHYACKNGLIKVCRLLLKRGASVLKANGAGKTALHCAAQAGHPQIVELLLNAKVPCDVRTPENCSPLLLACSLGNIKVCEQLISHNADVNVVAQDRSSPLSTALSNGHDKLVRLFLDHGALADKLQDNGYAPLHLAVIGHNVPLCKSLLNNKVDLEITSVPSEKTALHLAASNGFDDIVELLLHAGADSEAVDSLGDTPLFSAARVGHTQTCSKLFAHGASAAHIDSQGLKLHEVVPKKDRELKRFLQGYVESACNEKEQLKKLPQLPIKVDRSVTVRHHKEPFTRKRYETVPLRPQYATPVRPEDRAPVENYFNIHKSAAQGDYDGVLWYLKHMKTDVNALDSNGFTALHHAAKEGHLDVVKLLLQESVDWKLEGPGGVTALELAKINNQRSVENILSALSITSPWKTTEKPAKNPFVPRKKDGESVLSNVSKDYREMPRGNQDRYDDIAPVSTPQETASFTLNVDSHNHKVPAINQDNYDDVADIARPRRAWSAVYSSSTLPSMSPFRKITEKPVKGPFRSRKKIEKTVLPTVSKDYREIPLGNQDRYDDIAPVSRPQDTVKASSALNVDSSSRELPAISHANYDDIAGIAQTSRPWSAVFASTPCDNSEKIMVPQ